MADKLERELPMMRLSYLRAIANDLTADSVWLDGERKRLWLRVAETYKRAYRRALKQQGPDKGHRRII